MIETPFLGVGLLKMSSQPHGCGAGNSVEEFYVAIFGGRISPHKYKTYSEAVEQYHRLFNAAQKRRKRGLRASKVAELAHTDVA